MVLGGLCALLLLACGVLSSMQLGVWKNEETVVARIPQSDSNAFGPADYSAYLLHHGQLSQAQAEAELAARIDPENPRFQVLLGDILLDAHKTDQAIPKFQSALTLDHTLEIARLELGRAFIAQNRLTDAAEEIKTALHDQPKSAEAHNLLARVFILQGKPVEAEAEYRASLSLQANQMETLNSLAWMLATHPRAEIRRGAEAVQLARRACGLARGGEPVLLGTLAAALAETGDFDKAVEAATQAHDLALAQGRKPLADTSLQLANLFRAHKPYREKQ